MHGQGRRQIDDADRVSVLECLAQLGGVSSRRTLVRLTSRSEVDRALAAGDILRDARGRHALAQADEALRAAHALTGILSHASAALAWGWEVKSLPDRPHVTVAKNRKIDPSRRRGVELHRSDLHSDDIHVSRTGQEVTLEQCLRSLPFDEALAIADSALRHGVPAGTLQRIATSARGPGSPRIRNVAAHARAEAANPFESVLRAIAIDVLGLNVRPQVVLPGTNTRPDLVDEDLRIILEADSFEWHGSRAALRRDARRYNQMVVDGWMVLRFAWEDVMHDQDSVRSVLIAAVDRRTKVQYLDLPAA